MLQIRGEGEERTASDEASEIDLNPVLWIHFGTGDKRMIWMRMRGALDRVTLP